MEHDYWRGRWERGETGWHRDEVNAWLVRHWAEAGVVPGARVLVPLCGQSLDLTWLAGQGHPVLGVELSVPAVAGYFASSVSPPRRRAEGRFEVTGAGGVEIACGDVFDLADLDLATTVGFYDRAALIALPTRMRERYAETLGRCLPASARGLLITLEYDQTMREGPPFSVGPGEVHRLFDGRFEVELLADEDVLHENAGFQAAGHTWLREYAFALAPKGG